MTHFAPRSPTPLARIAARLAALLALATVVSAQKGVAYLFESSRQELVRFDLASGASQTMTAGLGTPSQIAVRGQYAWTVETSTGELSTVDLRSGEIATVGTGLVRPFGLALEPTTGSQRPGVAYVTDQYDLGGRLLAVDTATGAATTVAVGGAWPFRLAEGSIAISPDGSKIYAPGAGGVLRIDLPGGAMTTLPGSQPLGPNPASAVALSPDGGTLFFGIGQVGWPLVCQLDLTLAAASAVPVDFSSYGEASQLAISPNGNWRASASVYFGGTELLNVATHARWYVAGGTRGVTFFDDGTLVLTSWDGAVYTLDLGSGTLSIVDAGVHNAMDIEVIGSTAYLYEGSLLLASSTPGGGAQSVLYPRIVSVDLPSGRVSTVHASGYRDAYGLQASRDGTHLFFIRREPVSDRRELMDLDLATGFARPAASFTAVVDGFRIDAAGGSAHVMLWNELPGSRLARVDLGSGLTTAEFFVPSGLQGLSDFVVDEAAGRVIGQVSWSGSGRGLGVLGLAAGAATLLDFVPLNAAQRCQPSADGRTLYSLLNGGAQQGLVATDMLSPTHPQTVLVATGLFAAMKVLNTADGSDVVSTPVDATTGTSPVTLTFDDVVASGDTTVTTSTTGPTIPAGFQLGGAGVYYEVTTTATFAGNVEICIDYGGTTFTDENTLQLLHYEHGAWVNVTTTRDPDQDRICGVVRSFSPFVVVEWPAMNRLKDLVTRVHNLDVRHGIAVSLDAKLAAVQQALTHSLQGNGATAIQCLRAFILEVRAQRGQSLPAEVADELIADAEQIIALLGG